MGRFLCCYLQSSMDLLCKLTGVNNKTWIRGHSFWYFSLLVFLGVERQGKRAVFPVLFGGPAMTSSVRVALEWQAC